MTNPTNVSHLAAHRRTGGRLVAVQEVEGYCVDSGRPVRLGHGDRCLRHGDAPTPCRAAVRPARCEHPHLSPNHPYPHCSECGKDLPEATR